MSGNKLGDSLVHKTRIASDYSEFKRMFKLRGLEGENGGVQYSKKAPMGSVKGRAMITVQ
ncbi:hypothetical protein [Alteribacter natronophilus]|uniref:hypothetical protein n=1 Tax=Alteribacter natronophilus TaxID=2583810 RepID=UPI00110F3315|nr:hypothetical protein [Alteribacter natronophilus]TMW73158.1 hypothetical protein FGB90_02270 [Alteribacter natronophilus]